MFVQKVYMNFHEMFELMSQFMMQAIFMFIYSSRPDLIWMLCYYVKENMREFTIAPGNLSHHYKRFLFYLTKYRDVNVCYNVWLTYEMENCNLWKCLFCKKISRNRLLLFLCYYFLLYYLCVLFLSFVHKDKKLCVLVEPRCANLILSYFKSKLKKKKWNWSMNIFKCPLASD